MARGQIARPAASTDRRLSAGVEYSLSPAVHARDRRRGRARALALAQPSTRTGMVIRAGVDDRQMVSALGDQHPADLRDRVLRRLGARRHRRRDRRLVRKPRPRAAMAVAPVLARRRDHRRDGLAPRRGRRARSCYGLVVAFAAVYLPRELRRYYSIIFTFALLASCSRSAPGAVREARMSSAGRSSRRRAAIVGVGARLVVAGARARSIFSAFCVGHDPHRRPCSSGSRPRA